MTDGSVYRCGFVAVIGRPNVGKSTLINAILGRKVSIVTPKPQTTRHRILGVCSTDAYQAVFVDTPGLHRDGGKAMNRLMNKTATSAMLDADLVLFVSEAGHWRDADQDVIERLGQNKAPVLAILNKTDLVKPKEALLAAIGEMDARYDFAEILPVSARRRDNIDRLMQVLPEYLPESPALFPVEMCTDRSELFQVSELIREKLTLALRDELPYGLTVQIEAMDTNSDPLRVAAVVWVERESQKGIVIGKGGEMLKTVGQSARRELKRQLGQAVHLELWVKVKRNWANNEKELQRLGYTQG